MENIFIDFLPPWVETGLQPAFYDKESGTVLQQTARMYAKVNELIKGYHQQSQTINEYITKFNQLYDYVYDYFDNLDVQEEINNKLDDMAESGELAEIIAKFLGLGSVYGFDKISDMASAEYLVDGSICKTLGKTNALTGDGSFYRVRQRLNSDNPDGVNLIVLTNTSNLVAEIIPDYHVNQVQNNLNTAVSNTNKRLNLLENRKFIFIGDSYVTGSMDGQQFATDGWAARIKTKLNLSDTECYIYGEGGSGFTSQGHQGNTFVDLLSNNLSNINNKDEITDIVVCGGYNDIGSSVSGIKTAINNMATIINANFPNATFRVGMIGFNNGVSASHRSIRNNLFRVCVPGYKAVTEYNGVYLTGSECILSRDLMSNDNLHPNVDGYNYLAENIIQILKTGCFTKTTKMNPQEPGSIISIQNDTYPITQQPIINEKISDNNLSLIISDSAIMFEQTGLPIASGYNRIVLGTLTNLKYTLKNYISDLYNIPFSGFIGTSNNYPIFGNIGIADDDTIYIEFINNYQNVNLTNKIRINAMSYTRNITV